MTEESNAYQYRWRTSRSRHNETVSRSSTKIRSMTHPLYGAAIGQPQPVAEPAVLPDGAATRGIGNCAQERASGGVRADRAERRGIRKAPRHPHGAGDVAPV